MLTKTEAKQLSIAILNSDGYNVNGKLMIYASSVIQIMSSFVDDPSFKVILNEKEGKVTFNFTQEQNANSKSS